MVKAVIFDMDGVLIDAKEWHYEALNRALQLFGFEISRYDHLMNYDGLPTKDKLQMLTLEQGLPQKLHGFINELKQKYTMELVHAKLKPNFVHEYALSKLKSAGYQLAVGSNSIRNTVSTMLNLAEISDYFEFYLSNEDVKKAKPDPEIYITAIARLGLNPNECLIVEDNKNGIAAAHASYAHVLEIAEVSEVNLNSIVKRIAEIDATDMNLNER